MSEIHNEVVSDNTPDVVADPHETVARKNGWRPQEEWSGDPDKWYDAKTFNMRGELLKEIKSSHEQLNELKTTVKTIFSQHEKAREAGYKQALEELKQQKKQALLDGDVERVLELDDKIDETKEEFKAVKQEVKEEKQQVHPAFAQWVGQNDWYAKDVAMHDFADKAGILYRQTNPTGSFEDLLEYVSSEVKKNFPDRFGGNQKRQPTVEAGNNAGALRGSKGLSVSDLSEDEKKVMKTMLRISPGMTEQEYLKQLSATR
jgi:hypothetical protein